MWRQVVAGPAENAAARIRHLLAQPLDFAPQRVDLPLLADDDLVELVQQVFVEAGLDFQFGQAVVDGVVGFGRLHALIGHELAADPRALAQPAGVAGQNRASYNFSLCQKDLTCPPCSC